MQGAPGQGGMPGPPGPQGTAVSGGGFIVCMPLMATYCLSDHVEGGNICPSSLERSPNTNKAKQAGATCNFWCALFSGQSSSLTATL